MLLRLFFLSSGIVFWGIFFLLPINVAQAKRLYVNTNPLFEACLQRCEEQTPLGGLTRRGCFKGCAEIRRSFALPTSYRSMASCIEDMNDLELQRDLVIEKYQTWCDKEWSHLHKRKGCKDAMDVYIRSATVNSICYHQTPEAVVRQTPRSSMGIRHSTATTLHPSSAGGMAPAVSMPSSPSGDVLSMPPVYDTPKYRQTSPQYTPHKGVPPSATKTGKTAKSDKAPSLAPPKRVAKPTPQASPQPAPKVSKTIGQPVPVITPTTATRSPEGHPPPRPVQTGMTPPTTSPPTPPATPLPPAGQSGAVLSGTSGSVASQKPLPAQPVESINPVPPVSPVPPVQVVEPRQTPPATPLSQPLSQTQSDPASAPSPLPKPTPEQLPLTNAATEPTSPPVISPPMPVLPDLSGTRPGAPATPASQNGPSPQTPGKSAGLLPSLQPAQGQNTSPPHQAMKNAAGTNTPLPAPMP